MAFLAKALALVAGAVTFTAVSVATADAASCGKTGAGFEAWKAEFSREAAARGIKGKALQALQETTYATKTINADRNQKSFKLSLDQFMAKRGGKQIAAKGGVVGLWGLRSDVGATPESYGDRIIEMAGWLGDDHVGFGTDMNAVANSPVASYRDLRRVVRYLERKIAADRVRKIAIGNYARVLREAMEGAKA